MVYMNRREVKMTYTTASFDEGSEFRVQTVTITEHARPVRGQMETISIKNSEIFATYDEAFAHAESLNSYNKQIQVRRPGNKRFTSTRKARKS